MMFDVELLSVSFPVLAAGAGAGLCGAALILAFARLVMGPTLADRVVALDLITMILVVLLTLIALVVQDEAYLDAAIALALVGFLATVAFARYIDRADASVGAPLTALDPPGPGPMPDAPPTPSTTPADMPRPERAP
jgi:multicomponent Na+:H+ antiporter subunit F